MLELELSVLERMPVRFRRWGQSAFGELSLFEPFMLDIMGSEQKQKKITWMPAHGVSRNVGRLLTQARLESKVL
jgi:hypothetical protein